MKKFALTVLGSSAAMPAFGRFTSCQAINYNENYYLIDAGEGAQIRIGQYKVKRNKIKCIFISHLHGDHIFGLPGILTSFNHFDRKTPLRVFGPKGLKAYIELIFKMGQSKPRYELIVEEIEVNKLQEVWTNHELSVKAFPLHHRIETYGYRFDEKVSSYNIDPAAIEKYNLDYDEIKAAKAGQDIVRDGSVIPYKEVVFPKAEPRSYAYCSDTAYDVSIVEYIRSVSALYHETTYTEEYVAEAKERFHSTGKQAAKIATLAKADLLITGHYSARYKVGEEPFAEALEHFPNTHKGYDGYMLDL